MDKGLRLLIKKIATTYKNEDIYIFVSRNFLNFSKNKNDIFIVTHFTKNIDKNKIIELIDTLNEKNNLNDERFSLGGIYSFYDFTKIIKYTPFSIVGDRLYIKKTSKNKKFLSSEYCKNYVLLLAIIFVPKLLYGNESIFSEYVFEMYNTFLKIIFLFLKNKGLSKAEVENALFKSKNFLGFDKNILEYKKEDIKKNIETALNKLISVGLIKNCNNSLFYDEQNLLNFKIDIIDKTKDSDLKITLPKYKIRKLTDFSSNINPFAPSDSLIKKLRFSLNYINIYPEITNSEADQELSKFFNVNPKNIIVTNGSIESLALIPQILNVKNPGIIEPTFYGFESSIYESMNLKCRKIMFNKENNLYYDIESIETLASQCDIVYLCNINNPTSSYIDSWVLLEIIKKYKNCHFIVEESGFLYYKNFRQKSILSHVDNLEEIPNLSIVYCFSKFFGVAGLRIASLISSSNIINKIKKIQLPFSLNIIGQIALTDILNDKDFMDYTRKNNKNTMKNFIKMLKTLPNIKIYDTTTTFVLCELLNGKKSNDLCEKLEKKGFLVKNLSFKKEDGEIIRISVNNDFENNMLINELKVLLL